MQDIGMHPDYRSGVSDTEECMTCHQLYWRVDNCVECGKGMCPNCESDVEGTCQECTKIHCSFCGEEVEPKADTLTSNECKACGFIWNPEWDEKRLAQEIDAYDNDLAWEYHREDTRRRRDAERGVL